MDDFMVSFVVSYFFGLLLGLCKLERRDNNGNPDSLRDWDSDREF